MIIYDNLFKIIVKIFNHFWVLGLRFAWFIEGTLLFNTINKKIPSQIFLDFLHIDYLFCRRIDKRMTVDGRQLLWKRVISMKCWVLLQAALSAISLSGLCDSESQVESSAPPGRHSAGNRKHLKALSLIPTSTGSDGVRHPGDAAREVRRGQENKKKEERKETFGE